MRTVAIAMAAVSLTLAGALAAQNIGYTPDPKWVVPAEDAAKVNPLAGKRALAIGGRRLYRKNCIECHGEDGSGLVKKHAADLQLPVVQKQSDGALFWKITNGNTDRGMPSFSKLPELERWQMILYLRNLAAVPTAGTTPAAPTNPPDKK